MSECKIFDYPPIGETMHALGHCVCHLCTCGQHICPAKTNQKYYLPSSLKSTYKVNYTKKPPLPSEPFLPQSPKYSSPKRDFTSTAQADYIEHPPQHTPSAKYEKANHMGMLKFAGSSNYKQEYPNWGAYEFINVGKYKRSLSKRQLNLSPTTTYSENFKKLGEVRTQSQKRIETRSPILGYANMEKETNSKLSYKPINKEDFARRASNKNFGIIPLESPKSAYKTLYSSEFQNKESNTLLLKKKKTQEFNS